MIQRSTGMMVAGALALALPLAAQTAVGHVDFTGSWKVTGIEMPEVPGGFAGRGDIGGGGGGGRGRGFGGGRGRPQGGQGADAGNDQNRLPPLEEGQVVRIKQTDSRLIVTEETSGGAVMTSYGLDGAETTNKLGGAVTKSKSKWEGVAIVTDITRTIDGGRGSFSMKSREIRSLGPDGQTMILRRELDTPRGKQTMTVTYSKIGE